jgi:hypothetical protein
MKTSDGLQMSGLNEEAMESCRNIYSAFLKRHQLDSWNVLITAMKLPGGVIFNEKPHVELKLGLVNRRKDLVLAVAEEDLKHTLETGLDNFLEADYAARKK